MDMAQSVGQQQTRFLQEHAGYRVIPHPGHARLYHIILSEPVLKAFFKAFEEIGSQNLEYVPYMRFVVAQKLDELAGGGFGETLRSILNDRDSGGFTIGVEGVTTNLEEYVKFGTAISYLIGPANFDAMSGTYYARFFVKDTDNSDSYLRQAYRNMTLHTDGTYVDEVTDWLLMMKFEERNAVGGESRLMHLDDWEDLERFSEHPLASYALTYKSPPSKNANVIMHRRTFFKRNNRPCVCFIDQFAYPDTIEQAVYLHEMVKSIENSPATQAIPLPVGDLVMLNNTFWMHGRAAFEKHPDLHRELMRLRGYFSIS